MKFAIFTFATFDYISKNSPSTWWVPIMGLLWVAKGPYYGSLIRGSVFDTSGMPEGPFMSFFSVGGVVFGSYDRSVEDWFLPWYERYLFYEKRRTRWVSLMNRGVVYEFFDWRMSSWWVFLIVGWVKDDPRRVLVESWYIGALSKVSRVFPLGIKGPNRAV